MMKAFYEKSVKERIREYESSISETIGLLKKLRSRLGGFSKALNEEGVKEVLEIIRSLEKRRSMFVTIVEQLMDDVREIPSGCPGKMNSGAEVCWVCVYKNHRICAKTGAKMPLGGY